MRKSTDLARSPWFIFAVALATRLAIMVALYTSPQLSTSDFWATGLEMGRMGQYLVTTGEFRSPFLADSGPSAMLPPAYPLLVAAAFRWLGIMTPAAAWVILTLQALFSSLTCLAVFYLGKHSFGENAGAWAAWAWAVCPHTQFMPLFRFWQHSLAALLAACAFLFLLRLRDSQRLAGWAGLGAFTGLAALDDPALLSFVIALVFWFVCLRRRAGIPSARAVLLAALAFAIVLAPWTIRNYRLFHQLVPIRDGFWLEVWVGNNPQNRDGQLHEAFHPVMNSREGELLRTQGEIPYLEHKQQLALDFIRRQPGRFLSLTGSRIAHFWIGWDDFGLSRTTLPLFLLAAWELLSLAWRRREEAVAYALPVLVYPLPYYITHSDVRFRHSIEPILFVLAGSALAAIQLRSQAWFHARPGPGPSPQHPRIAS